MKYKKNYNNSWYGNYDSFNTIMNIGIDWCFGFDTVFKCIFQPFVWKLLLMRKWWYSDCLVLVSYVLLPTEKNIL